MEFKTMKEALELYSVATKTLDEKKEELSNLMVQFEEQNKNLIDSISNLNQNAIVAKDLVKVEAEKEFKQTGEKKLLGGIGIRVSTILNYSTDDAVTWAKEKMPIAVTEVVNKKQFESFAKENDLEFVEKEEKVTITFPKEIII